MPTVMCPRYRQKHCVQYHNAECIIDYQVVTHTYTAQEKELNG